MKSQAVEFLSDSGYQVEARGSGVLACCQQAVLCVPASSAVFLLSGSESTAEDAEDAEEKRECGRATHYTPLPDSPPRGGEAEGTGCSEARL